MHPHLSEPYRPRPVRDLGVLEHEGWRLKRIGIAYGRDEPRPELMEAADAAARQVLPLPAVGEGRYGVGYLGIHDGRGEAWAFVDWWADENELHHHVFIAPTHTPTALVERTAEGRAACVWDLAVMSHERDAWMRTFLTVEHPDVDAYLAARLDGEI